MFFFSHRNEVRRNEKRALTGRGYVFLRIMYTKDKFKVTTLFSVFGVHRALVRGQIWTVYASTTKVSQVFLLSLLLLLKNEGGGWRCTSLVYLVTADG